MMVKACSGCQFGLCRWFTYRTIIPPTLFQVFTLKHPSALDGHTHSTVPTHTVPKHAGPSGHSFIPQVGTPHVCAPHTVPSTIVDFCGHVHTRFQQSPIFHLIVIDFAPAHHILGLSLPNSTLLSNFLLLTFHTIVDFHTHTHPPFVDCHQLCICPMPMGHHHPPSTSFSTSSPLISCGPCYPCHMPARLWPGVSSALQLGRSFGGVG